MAITYESCTPMVEGYGYHITRGDFYDLCDEDATSTNILRVLEVDTNQRIDKLRKAFGIPENMLPADEDLWIDKPSARRLEELTIHARSKSTYAPAFAENDDAWLIRKGFVKQRYIARIDTLQTDPLAPVFQDRQGLFLVVANDNGDYWGKDGKIHNALREGWREVICQVLYVIDVVNAGLAWLAGRKPSPKSKRHRPVAVARVKLGKGGGLSTMRKATTTCSTTSVRPARHSKGKALQGGSEKGALPEVKNTLSPNHQYNAQIGGRPVLDTSSLPSDEATSALPSVGQMASQIDQRKLSKTGQGVSNSGQGVSNSGEKSSSSGHRRYREDKGEDISLKVSKKESALARLPLLSSKIDVASLRTAEWSPQTIVALASQVLPIPDPEGLAEGSEELKAWLRDWGEPAQRAYDLWRDLSPAQAWEHVDLLSRFMTDPTSPSWFVTGRARQSQVTLRHVMDNHVVQWNDFQRRDWYPKEQTLYDGPGVYAQGYTGTSVPQSTAMPSEERPDVVEAEITVQATVVEEAAPAEITAHPPRLPGRGWKPNFVKIDLERIVNECPTIRTKTVPLEGDWVAIALEYAPDQWVELRMIGDWYFPAPELQPYIDAAKQLYAGPRTAAKSSADYETTLPTTGPLQPVAAISA